MKLFFLLIKYSRFHCYFETILFFVRYVSKTELQYRSRVGVYLDVLQRETFHLWTNNGLNQYPLYLSDNTQIITPLTDRVIKGKYSDV